MGNKKHTTRYMVTGRTSNEIIGKPYIYYRLVSARKYALQLLYVDYCESVEIRSLTDGYAEILTVDNVADAVKLVEDPIDIV